MRRCNYAELIEQSPEELLKQERRQSHSINRDRLRFIRLLKEGQCMTQKEAGQHLGLQIAQSQVIWRLYREKGIAGLLDRTPKRSWGKLDSKQISRLRKRLSGHDIYTQAQIIDWVKTEMGIVYTQSGMSRLLKRLHIKLKTGRPVNVRKDEEGEKRFKKTSLV